jgi:hypothetical protein
VRTGDALRTCVVVVLVSLPNSKEVLSEMWVMGGLRLILIAHSWLIPPPSGWSLSRMPILHGKVGRVIDINGHIGFYFPCNQVDITATLGSLKGAVPPRKDLQTVLKMAVGGNCCGMPAEAQHPLGSIGQIVKEVQKEMVLNSGLAPGSQV